MKEKPEQKQSVFMTFWILVSNMLNFCIIALGKLLKNVDAQAYPLKILVSVVSCRDFDICFFFKLLNCIIFIIIIQSIFFKKENQEDEREGMGLVSKRMISCNWKGY